MGVDEGFHETLVNNESCQKEHDMFDISFNYALKGLIYP